MKLSHVKHGFLDLNTTLKVIKILKIANKDAFCLFEDAIYLITLITYK